MKKLTLLLSVLLILTGCAPKVDLMPNASPETSALGLYIYDGETITGQYLYDDQDEVIADLQNAKATATEVDVTTLEPPFYGLWMGAGDLGEAEGLWADGYFITKDGTAYEFDYDFEGLLSKHPWDEPDTYQDLRVMPCAAHAAKTEAGWNKHFLSPAFDPVQPPEGLTIEAEQKENAMLVRYTNNGAEEWGYGLAFSLQTELDGLWYHIPSETTMAFAEILIMVPQGAVSEETYDYSPYGRLPAGNYRIIAEHMVVAEFAVET